MMKIEEIEIVKFIHPNDVWQCFICLKQKIELSALAENEREVFLICDACRLKLASNFLENKTPPF